MSARWTDETEELVAQAYADTLADDGEDVVDAYRSDAVQILTALADAGLLLPPGGETRELRGRGAGTSGLVRTVTTHADGSKYLYPWREVTEEAKP